MMAHSMPFIILMAALLINNLSCCSAENVYCVTPTATSCSSCSPNSANCSTLPEYAQEAELYFTSNITIMFLPGDHALATNITVANIARLTMRGENSSGNTATVVCNGLVGFTFTSMVDFKIHSLAFTNCSRNYAIPPDLVSELPFALYTAMYLKVALFINSTQYAEIVNCSFHDNWGTALAVNDTNIILVGNSNFTHNHCTEFNSCVGGGGIAAFSSNLSIVGNTTFFENRASLAGAGMYVLSSKLNSTGNIHLMNNLNSGVTPIAGGTLYASASLLHFTGTNNFINNSALSLSGFGLYNFGGAILAIETLLNFSGVSNFKQNLAAVGGGAITALNNSVLSFSGTTNFSSNRAIHGGAIFLNLNTTLLFDGIVIFTDNGCDTSEVGPYGASSGGGMYLVITSTFSLLPNTTMYWVNNYANLGGAIHVMDVPEEKPHRMLSYCTQFGTSTRRRECIFQLPGHNLSSGINTQLVFKNNSADIAGSVLYGGEIDDCKLTGLDSYSSGEVFDMLVHIEDDNTHSTISSDPFRICLCENNLPNCGKSHVPYTVYPGETFQVSVIAYGQRNGTIAAAVRSHLDIQFPAFQQNIPVEGDKLQGYQYLQKAHNTCTTLNYTIFSLSQIRVSLDLYTDGPCSIFGNALSLKLTINQNCPHGFNLSESASSCVCEQRLAKYTNLCNITNGLGRITRESQNQFWVGYDNQSHELILHPFCPFDYRVSKTVVFPLNDTDSQCAYNRSSLLCGACKRGYSLVIGTSQCEQCTNSSLALLIPFAVMGVALVFLLLVCKLTVATGTLSGLVFYANIVGINRTIFLQVETQNILSIFIAWLNLDLGIKTCFYDGMDAYSKTWIQFVFPVYIWVLVGLMILGSRFSHRFANLLGNNPVSVLATLILLSYTKILRTLIAAIHITYLEYPTYNRAVWLYDANIDYLSIKHIPLFLVAVLVFFLLFLPYTLLLLFGQWLQAISHLRHFSWVNRLKPLIDSYQAPYKAKHRYWPGLLLVLRFVLLLVFAFNYQEDPSINLVAILVGAGILQLWAWIGGGVYTNWCLDALEGSFALNLIIMVGATLYNVNHSREDQAAWYISVSLAFVTFIGILTYHTFQQSRQTKLWKKVPKLNLKFNKLSIKQVTTAFSFLNYLYGRNSLEVTPNNTVTHTEVDISELRSPLNLLDTK